MKSIKQAVCFLLVGLLCTVIIYPLLHELGHSLAAIALGGEIVQLSWLPIPSVLCKMNSPNTSQYVIVGLSGMIFPALLCIFVRSNRFWVWYLMFIMKLTAAWSLVLAGLSVFLFQKGITLPNDDMTIILERAPDQWWIYALLIILLFLAVCLSVGKSKPVRRIISVMVSRDGGPAQTLSTSWSDSSVDTHIGSFTLADDADYIVTINYRDKSGNTMTEYQSSQMTIDTKIEEPTYSINGVAKSGDDGGAYKDEANISFNFEDQNFDTQTVKLVRTRFNETKDVTADFVKVGLNEKGGSGSFDIAKKVDNDGIYVLTVTMTDKAGHSTESHIKFTINRYGSVYEYSDYLTSLIKDGGQYIAKNGDAAITDDLVITEYNADRIVKGSLKIVITRDGETIDTKFTASPEASDNTAIGSSGWYQYVYTISKENFTEDGVYNITITSEDATGNTSTSVPDNSVAANGEKILDVMTFTVDTTAPEIRNIVGLDKKIVNAQEQDVKYTIVDVGGLQQIEVIVNGQTADTITDFGDDLNSYAGTFTLSESNEAQTVQLKVTDLAGNVTDTASDDFNPGERFVFNDVITVSTNFFVRWYANAPLFWGSIGGAVVVTAGIWLLIVAKRKKNAEEK